MRIRTSLIFVLGIFVFTSTGLAQTQRNNHLRSIGIVLGAVTDDGVPVADVRVTLFKPGLDYFRETRTSENGIYAFVAPNDTYRLGVALRDSDYQEIGVSVTTGLYVRNFALQPETEQGSWDIIGSTLPEFLDATDIAALMPDGKIFYCHDTTDPILFDPVNGSKTFPSGFALAGGCMNGSLLENGRVIFAGGQDGSDPGNYREAIRWVRTWHPQTDVWQQLPDLQHPTGRWYPGFARLNDGSFLIMGGGTAPNAIRTDTCELFDLDSQTWSYTGSMVNPCEFPPSALLFNGKVLATWWPPQLYDTTTEQWRSTGNFNQPNRNWPGHSDHSLIVMDDGRALAIGIRGQNNTNMGEVYDPNTEIWSLTSNPGLLRFQCEVVQLPDGRILVGGGQAKDANPPVDDVLGIVKWSDLYDPQADSWRRVSDMNWFREYHAVTLLLPDGRIATTGGTRIKFQVGPTSADIEAYNPPYLQRGVRPQITDISQTNVKRGKSLTLSIFPKTKLTSVVLMGTQTTTHWVDSGIPRRLVLPVEQVGLQATIDLPTDPNVLPLGHYMLFAMVDDIPSVARIINVR